MIKLAVTLDCGVYLPEAGLSLDRYVDHWPGFRGGRFILSRMQRRRPGKDSSICFLVALFSLLPSRGFGQAVIVSTVASGGIATEEIRAR